MNENSMQSTPPDSTAMTQKPTTAQRHYTKPGFVRYGNLRTLTQGGNGDTSEEIGGFNRTSQTTYPQ